MRAARWLSVDLLSGDGLQELDKLRAERVFDRVVILCGNVRRGRDGRRQLDLPNGGHESHDLDPIRKLQVLLRNSPSRYSAYTAQLEP